MRLFVAVHPPDKEKERLLDWLASAQLDSTRLRLTPSDQWHLTLSFYERTNAAGRRVGLDLETRRYRAHLTIARPRQGPIDLTRTLAALPPYLGEPFRVTTIRLVRSHLGPPVRHEPLDEFPLG